MYFKHCIALFVVGDNLHHANVIYGSTCHLLSLFFWSFDSQVLLPAAWTVVPDSEAVNDVYTDAQVSK